MKFLAAFIGMVVAQECVDGEGLDSGGDGCDWYYENDGGCGWYDTDSFVAADICCACENPHAWEADSADTAATDAFGGDGSCTETQGTTDLGGDDCAWYWANPGSCGDWDDDDFTASACCACA